MNWFKSSIFILSLFGLLSCSGGGSNMVTINGRVTFDLVPHFSSSAGLDYLNTIAAPVRGATIQLLNSEGSILRTAQTDDDGNYSLNAPASTSVRVRVTATYEQSDQQSWDFSVTDNTNNNALYVLDGSLSSSGTEASIRDLHAASGWDGSDYSGTRAAAPFAILDSVYDAVQTILAVDTSVTMTPAEIRWSENNRPINGNRANGDIGTSIYDPSEKAIYLLGAADNDTDEYDRSVIIHEWGHYFEDTFSRSDSIGGQHTLSASLDLRVAFGEGWGNAFAGMVANDPVYRDSAGANQVVGFLFSVEDGTTGNQGWFVEGSIQAILFDLFDSNSDGQDSVSLGFGPLYEVLTSDSYVNFDGVTSIFSFVTQLKTENSSQAAAITSLLTSEGVNGTDAYGSDETNNGGFTIALPIYETLSLGETVNVCSNRNSQKFNGLDVRRFIRVNLNASGSRTITATRTSGLSSTDPDLLLYRNGSLIQRAESTANNTETLSTNLSADNYLLEVYEFSNIDLDNAASGGLACFDVSVI